MIRQPQRLTRTDTPVSAKTRFQSRLQQPGRHASEGVDDRSQLVDEFDQLRRAAFELVGDLAEARHNIRDDLRPLVPVGGAVGDLLPTRRYTPPITLSNAQQVGLQFIDLVGVKRVENLLEPGEQKTKESRVGK